MKKCIKCGRSFLTRFKIQLADECICKKCFEELGFDSKMDALFSTYKWDDIKDGYDAYRIKRSKEEIKRNVINSAAVKFSHYGEERELVATEEERKVFEILREMYGDDQLELVRVSDNYVTAKLGPWDVARIKYSPRAKWVMFPTAEIKAEKHRIEAPEDVRGFEKPLNKSREIIAKYSH